MSFFFTQLDDSLRPRGSRDPLGIELLWSGIGRKLVGNLTTVTRHLDNFIVTLVGFHLCVNETTGQTDWESFERFEQLTCRARVRRGLSGVIGVRRIRSSADFPLKLGSDRHARILDNPRQAGLWGLYSTALTSAGLTNELRRPTPLGEGIAEGFLATAHGDIWRLALDRRRLQVDEPDMKRMDKWVVSLLADSASRKLLANRLLSGSDSPQRWHGEVFEQAHAFIRDKKQVPPAREFLDWLSKKSELLQDFAHRALCFDETLTLSAITFDWLLGCHGHTAKKIEKDLAALAKWPFRQPTMPNFSAEMSGNNEWRARADGLATFIEAMAQGAWREATERLLSHHARVVSGRNGSPWCYWEQGRIKVVLNITPGTLPVADELSGRGFTTWMETRSNDFFLSAFLSILRQAHGTAQGEEA
jgi:hypothetical protein